MRAMDSTSLFLGVILGSIGTGYFVYGKKQRKGSAMISGALLCGLPWFISNNLLLVAAGILVAAVPFIV
jgi:hypothetical protein